MTNYFINYENVISSGVDFSKQLLAVMINTKCFLSGDSFWPTEKKKIINCILMKPMPGVSVKAT